MNNKKLSKRKLAAIKTEIVGPVFAPLAMAAAVPGLRRHLLIDYIMIMKRRLVSLLLALAITFTMLPIQVFAAGADKSVDVNPFEDVKQGSWYYDAVQYVRVNGLFYGTSKTTFWPEGTMTRGMFVTVLGRMAGVHRGMPEPSR